MGKCGTLDVRDCLDCVHHVVSTSKIADPLRIFVDGGSHGGFLALHLVGQHPNTFRAAIARNPVTAANLMEGTNDIPDWCVWPTSYDLYRLISVFLQVLCRVWITLRLFAASQLYLIGTIRSIGKGISTSSPEFYQSTSIALDWR